VYFSSDSYVFIREILKNLQGILQAVMDPGFVCGQSMET